MDDPSAGPGSVARWPGGASWIAHPGERLERASHALVEDGEVHLVDPVDAPGLDDWLAELGEVVGVVVGLDRHRRDAASIARRHDVPVALPAPLAGLADDLDAETTVVGSRLPGTGYRLRALVDTPLWSEVALHDPAAGTLVVPEAVGTAPHYLAAGERLGVHPLLRLRPPRRALGGLAPERVLVGHGEGVHEGSATALEDALASARRNAPRLYVSALRSLLAGRGR